MSEFDIDQVINAIEQWLEYGEDTWDKSENYSEYDSNIRGHRGYYGPDGWAYECLKYYLKKLKTDHHASRNSRCIDCNEPVRRIGIGFAAGIIVDQEPLVGDIVVSLDKSDNIGYKAGKSFRVHKCKEVT